MIIHNVQQGSPEWLTLRSGIPTASRFSDIITKSGKPSQSSERYMYTLLAERLMGHPIAEHMSMWQQRGSQLEADAIRFYELQVDADTEPIGFVTSDDGRYGASPDRFVGPYGTLEIKCPSEYIHVQALMQSGTTYETYRQQCMGQLWITERSFVDVLSYHPEMEPALVRIERDDEYIAKLAAAVTAFSQTLEQNWEICMERGWVREKPRQEPTLVQALKESLIEVNKR